MLETCARSEIQDCDMLLLHMTEGANVPPTLTSSPADQGPRAQAICPLQQVKGLQG